MKISEWQMTKKYLERPKEKKEKEVGYKSKLDRLVENPPPHLKPEPILDYIDRVRGGSDPFKYQSWNGKTTPDDKYNALPKDMFQKMVPLPKIKKRIKIEPLNLPFLPTEFDEPKPKAKREIKRPKAEGIVSVLNLIRLG